MSRTPAANCAGGSPAYINMVRFFGRSDASIATHFAEAVGPERRFATELLHHLASRTKGRAGEEARLTLRVAGM